MLRLAYCDKIAFEIRKALTALVKCDPDRIIGEVSGIDWDLNDDGSFRSPAKSITVYDTNGKAYIVSIQEAELLDREPA